MRNLRWLRRAGRLGMVAVVALACGAARADDEPAAENKKEEGRKAQIGDEPRKDRGEPKKTWRVEVREGAEPKPAERGQIESREALERLERMVQQAQRAGRSEYWLGLEVSPARGALRAQMDLPKDQGLVVDQVLPDSPAAKAGVKQFDVLLSADDKPLKEISDLQEQVENAKDKDFELKYLRAGKSETLTVKAEKRPEPGQRGGFFAPGAQIGREGDNRLRMQFLQPGAAVPPGVAIVNAPFPEDLSVTITKRGNKPAEIEAKQGEQTWKTAENKLAELPPNVRGPIEGLLGRGPFGGLRFSVGLMEGGAPMNPRVQVDPRNPFGATPLGARQLGGPQPGAPQLGAPPGAATDRLERRLDALGHQLHELREELEGLRERRPRPPREDEDRPNPPRGEENRPRPRAEGRGGDA